MFYYGDIILNTDNVYEPAEDSIMLADIVSSCDLAGKKVLDMGTGSGLLAIVASAKHAIVTASDIDSNAVDTAHKNSLVNKVDIDVIESDMFSNITGKFDVIMFNSPYLPSDEIDKYAEKRIDYDGGKNGRDIIRIFLEQVKEYLNEKGRVLLLISSLTDEKELIKMLENNGFQNCVICRKKIEWEELIVFEISTGG